MVKKRRSISHLDDLPGLFDELEIDLTRPDMAGDLIARHREEAQKAAAAIDARSPISELGSAQPHTSPTDRLLFISLGSGSSGNCAYLGNGREGILIDAGIDSTIVKTRLKDNGIDFKGIRGILLTHDHSDHVRFAYQLLRKQTHMLLYATPRTLSGVLRRHSISSRIKDFHKPIYKEHPFELASMTVTAFETSHDGTDNVGFHITFGDYHSFVVMTDTGCVTERGDYYMQRARYIMLESNYDEEMLHSGSYPEFLKARIKSNRGHLGNIDAAAYLQKVYTTRLSHIFLCHLSNDNNTPELALASARHALEQAGATVGDGSGNLSSRNADVQLMALPRYDASPLIVFREPR